MANRPGKKVSLKKEVRPLQTVLDDYLFPSDGGLLEPHPEFFGKRLKAVAHVLCRIPERDYKVLCDRVDWFRWFLPWEGTDGEIHPFGISHWPNPHPIRINKQEERFATVLYLSPELERVDLHRGIGAVAHELAHVVLGHEILGPPKYDQQEEEAWKRVNTWGFGYEASLCKAAVRRAQQR